MHKRKLSKPMLLLLVYLPLLVSCGKKQQSLPVRLESAEHTANIAATVRSKTIESNVAMLADMPGSLAEEAGYYAKRADENYRAGLTCERIYNSVRDSNYLTETY